MPVVNVILKSTEARRYQDPQGQVKLRIDHNSAINLVQAESDDKLRIDFQFTTNYGALGVIKLEGSVLVQDLGAREAADVWNDTRNLPQALAQQVHGAILQTCITEAVGLAKTVRMPPPLPLPQVRIQGAKGGQSGQPGAKGAPDGPEIG